MKIAVQVPIKSKQSTRVPNKNFRDLSGKPVSHWLLDELLAHCPKEWDIFIDSESPSVMEKLSDSHRKHFKFFQRDPWFASDHANGNHLISQFSVSNPEYDIYLQTYVTAVTLTGKIFMEAVQEFIDSRDKFDSMFLATEETGWFWRENNALNYDPSKPDGLPRSQDATVIKETTGLYGITRDAALRTGCRIGNRPLIYTVPRAYAVDIDTMEDFYEAEKILKDRSPLPSS